MFGRYCFVGRCFSDCFVGRSRKRVTTIICYLIMAIMQPAFASTSTADVDALVNSDETSQSSASAGSLETLDPTAVVVESTARAQPVAETLVSNPAYYLQILLVLVFIIALIFVCAWLAKKMNAGGFMGSQQLKLLGGLSVGTRERVVLIEVGDKQLLLGVAPGRVNALHVFDEPVINSQQPEMSEFAKKIQMVLRKDSSVSTPQKSNVEIKGSSDNA